MFLKKLSWSIAVVGCVGLAGLSQFSMAAESGAEQDVAVRKGIETKQRSLFSRLTMVPFWTSLWWFDLTDEYSENGVTLTRVGKAKTPLGLPLANLTWSPDGRYLASPLSIAPTRDVVWDTNDWEQVLVTKREYWDPGTLTFTPDSKHLITSEAPEPTPGNKYFMSLWDIETGQVVRNVSGYYANWAFNRLEAVAPVADQNLIIVLNRLQDRSDIQLLDTNTWTVRQVLGNGGYKELAVRPNSTVLAVAGHLGEVDVWDYVGRTKLRSFKPHEHNIAGLMYTHDGKYLVTSQLVFNLEQDVNPSSWISVWDAVTLERKWSYRLDGNNRFIHSMSVSHDGRYIAVVYGEQVLVLDGQSDQVLTSIEPPFPVVSVSFSPVDNRLAVGGGEFVRVFDVQGLE